MKRPLEHLGNGTGIVGVVLCAVAGLTRLGGLYHLAGFELMTLYLGGMGLMLMACLAKLHLLGMTEH